MVSTKKIKINGIEVEVLGTATKEEDVAKEPSLKKEDRSNLRNDKWLYLKTTIETGLEKKYSEVSLSETDLSTLANTYELVQQNKLLLSHLQKWDVDDVFTIVKSVDFSTGDVETADLLSEWPTVTIDDVCKSNAWYNTHTSKTTSPWIRQNLEMSHEFIIDSCDEEL